MIELIQNLFEQFRSSTRMQLGVSAVFLILLANFAFSLNEYRHALDADHKQLSKQLNRLNAIAAGSKWRERVEEAAGIRALWEARFRPAASRGLAQAQVDEMMRAALLESEAQNFQVDIATAQRIRKESDYWEVRASANGGFTPQGLLKLLRRIETREKATVVQQLDITVTRTNTVFATLTIAAFFSIPESTDDGTPIPTENQPR